MTTPLTDFCHAMEFEEKRMERNMEEKKAASKLTDAQKRELIEWVRRIYSEVDDEELPEIIIDKLYDFACENNDVPDEFLPETMPFGKFKGCEISSLKRGYIETLLMHNSRKMHRLLVKALLNRLREIEFVNEYASSQEDDYSEDTSIELEMPCFIPNRY